jgi:hypothetical protein
MIVVTLFSVLIWVGDRGAARQVIATIRRRAQ